LRAARFRAERAWVTGPDAYGLPTRGWVTVEPNAITYVPKGAVAKVVGRSHLVHTAPDVECLRPRLLPRVTLALHDRRNRASVMFLGGHRRRLLHALSSAGFDVVETRTWLRVRRR
jgi:hypothetical protein